AWLLEYERMSPREIEPLMGWTGSNDTSAQVRLSFDTKEEAIAFAEKLGTEYRVEAPPPDRERRGLSYSDNFKATRLSLWTH
ncbi:MAG TPA: NADH dehydrogenase ubiquinone Fe-S protein 4, partial [Beijerinckiaceae bacterium]|nr:NADH dehydrogenase ubiquinone Fe-S protein 4 [Beijerinckiaceae bacterium]